MTTTTTTTRSLLVTSIQRNKDKDEWRRGISRDGGYRPFWTSRFMCLSGTPAMIEEMFVGRNSKNSIFQRALKRHQKTKTRTSTYVVKLLGCSCLTSSNICDVSRVSACENPLRLFSFKSRYLGCQKSISKRTRTFIHFCKKKYAFRRKSCNSKGGSWRTRRRVTGRKL